MTRLFSWLLAASLVGAASAPQRIQSAPTVERDVRYAPGGSADQTLDLYLPGRPEFATVLFIHGGSLQEHGERRTSPVYARICEPFVARGMACATIDYRLAPAHRWPAMPDDAAAAVKWVRARVTEAGGNQSRLFLFGHSSGCSLAATLGTNPKFLNRVDLAPRDLAGVIAMGCILTPLAADLQRAALAGLTDDEMKARWTARSTETSTYASFEDRLDSDPSRFVGPDTPPTLVVVAQAERFRPPILEQGAHFVDLLYRAGCPADLVVVPGTHYSSIEHLTEPDDPALNAILAFIDDPRAAGLGSRPASIK